MANCQKYEKPFGYIIATNLNQLTKKMNLYWHLCISSSFDTLGSENLEMK